MQIHISTGGQVQGPFTIEQINQGLEEGRWSINSTIAWYKGCSGWMPLKDVPGVKVRVEKPVSPPISEPEQEEPTETIAVDTSPQSPQALVVQQNLASIVYSILALGFLVASPVAFAGAAALSSLRGDMELFPRAFKPPFFFYMPEFLSFLGILCGIVGILLAVLAVRRCLPSDFAELCRLRRCKPSIFAKLLHLPLRGQPQRRGGPSSAGTATAHRPTMLQPVKRGLSPSAGVLSRI
jgi:hypothetical protein